MTLEIVGQKKLLKRLNLGAGKDFRPDWVNVDCDPRWNPDVLCDVSEGLPFPDNTFDIVIARDFLEHIPLGKTIFVVEEIWRVLKPDGIFEHMTPSTDGRGAFQDPTHASFWNCNSWLYYMDDAHRKLIDTRAKFGGVNRDKVTNPRLGIVHTIGRLYAMKGKPNGGE